MGVFAQANASILPILAMHGLPPHLLQCVGKGIMSPVIVNHAVYVFICVVISFQCDYLCTCIQPIVGVCDNTSTGTPSTPPIITPTTPTRELNKLNYMIWNDDYNSVV